VLGNESQQVLDFAYLNSLHHTGVRNHLDDAILNCRDMPGHSVHFQSLEMEHTKLDEFPFDYDRKLASILVKHGAERLLLVKGSIDAGGSRCSHVEYRGKRSAMGPDGLASVHAIVDEMLEDGMKVLAIAYKPLARESLETVDEQGLILLGYLAFFDAPKHS